LGAGAVKLILKETQLCVLQKVSKKDWRAAKLILKETQLCVLQKVPKKDWRAAKLILKETQLCVLQKVPKKDRRAAKLILKENATMRADRKSLDKKEEVCAPAKLIRQRNATMC
jgi:hypothetical protein